MTAAHVETRLVEQAAALRRPLLVVGCGFVGARLAAVLRAAGKPVFCVAQTLHHGRPIDWPLNLGPGLAELSVPAPIQHAAAQAGGIDVVYLVPPEPVAADAARTDTPAETAPEAPASRLARFLDGVRRAGLPVRQLIYVGSTGVYGDHAGATIDEGAACRSRSPRAQARLVEEATAQAFDAAAAGRREPGGEPGAETGESSREGSLILRLSGIYGPGRIPDASLQHAGRLLCPGLATPGNRVHLDDIVQAILGALEHRARGVVHLAAADHRSHTEFVWLLADLLRRPRPSCTANRERWARDHPGIASFLSAARIIDSGAARARLGWAPAYDDARAGLLASIARP